MQTVITILIAISISVLTSIVGGRAWNRIRAVSYRRHSLATFNQSKSDKTPLIGFRSQQLTSASRELTLADHYAAVRLQDEFHFIVGTALTALAVAFVSMSFALTIGRNDNDVLRVVAILDVTCLVIALCCTLRGRLLIRQWRLVRCLAELMRQWHFIDVVLGLSTDTGDITSQYEKRRELVRDVLRRNSADLTKAINEYWRNFSAEISARQIADSEMSTRLSLYFRSRVQRQVRWFAASCRRLTHQFKIRRALVETAYYCVLFLAVLKALLMFEVVQYGDKQYVTFALLCCVGFASMITALFVNQNSRSLSHRYETQLVEMDRICASFSAIKLDCVKKQAWLPLVIKFEGSMVDELSDWLRITHADELELSP